MNYTFKLKLVMKNLSISFFLLFVLNTACKKDETTTPNAKPSESPVAKILEDKTWTQTTFSNGPFELGYIFSSSVKGKITQVGCRMPDLGIYTVSIWEEGTKKLVRQKTVEQSSPEKFTLVTVDELAVEKDVKYVISVNSAIGGVKKSYFQISNATANIFPIVRGSIVIQKTVYNNGAVPTFPATGSYLDKIFGYADFTFTPD